jgi:integrase
MSLTQPIRDKGKVRDLIGYYRKKGQIRNYLLIVMGIYTALRVGDLLKITWGDVYDFKHKRINKSVTITEKKTGKSKIIALNKNIIKALTMYKNPDTNKNTPLFINARTNKAISRIQAYRVIRAASDSLKFEERVSCHSLRKTFGYHSWKDGVSPAVIMEIYNHSSLSVTRRYLGIT